MSELHGTSHYSVGIILSLVLRDQPVRLILNRGSAHMTVNYYVSYESDTGGLFLKTPDPRPNTITHNPDLQNLCRASSTSKTLRLAHPRSSPVDGR